MEKIAKKCFWDVGFLGILWDFMQIVQRFEGVENFYNFLFIKGSEEGGVYSNLSKILINLS